MRLLMIDNYDSFTWNLVQYLQALGAEIVVDHGFIRARCNGRLEGARHVFFLDGAGATENVLMAAARYEASENLARDTVLVTTIGTVVVLLHGLVLMELMRLGVEANPVKFAVALGLSWAVGLALLATPLSRPLAGVPQQWHPLSPSTAGVRP